MKKLATLIVSLLMTLNSFAAIIYSINDGNRLYLTVNQYQGNYLVSR